MSQIRQRHFNYTRHLFALIILLAAFGTQTAHARRGFFGRPFGSFLARRNMSGSRTANGSSGRRQGRRVASTSTATSGQDGSPDTAADQTSGGSPSQTASQGGRRGRRASVPPATGQDTTPGPAPDTASGGGGPTPTGAVSPPGPVADDSKDHAKPNTQVPAPAAQARAVDATSLSAMDCAATGISSTILNRFKHSGFFSDPGNAFLPKGSALEPIEGDGGNIKFGRSSEIVLRGTKDHVFSVDVQGDRLTLRRDGQRSDFSLAQYLPAGSKSAQDVVVYGNIDPVTGVRKPAAMEIRFFERQAPKLTGIARIDEDRFAKYQGQRKKHDGDQVQDFYWGSLIVRLDDNGMCPIAGVQRQAPDTKTIKLSQGREYFFGLGPNEFRRRPQSDLYQQRSQALADLYIKEQMEKASSQDCKTVIPADIKRQMATTPPGLTDACILPNGSRPGTLALRK